MRDASVQAHNERMDRGTAAVRGYLQAQFPGYVVEVLERSSRDHERSIRTFKVRKDREQLLLWVTHEVLDLDTGGVDRHLRKFGVAGALRQVGSGKALLVTTDGARAEPIP